METIGMRHEGLLKVSRGRWLARTGEGARRRRVLALSAAEVAEAVGVSALTLRRWEAGEAVPSAAAAARWYEVIRDLSDLADIDAEGQP